MGTLHIEWPPCADLDVWVFGCHGDVIGLPLHPTYKCSFHCVNEMAWEQPGPFTTVWLYVCEACCWLQAEKQLSSIGSRPVNMNGGGTRAEECVIYVWSLLLCNSTFPFLPCVQTSPVPGAHVSLFFNLILSSLCHKHVSQNFFLPWRSTYWCIRSNVITDRFKWWKEKSCESLNNSETETVKPLFYEEWAGQTTSSPCPLSLLHYKIDLDSEGWRMLSWSTIVT